MQRVILHIDLDSFFASVEQQANPLYRGRALGVTATNGRSCIIASSREAKKLGIGTASRVYEARRICPKLILVPADFNKYFTVSKQFIRICKDYSPYVELFSIDELFMDVTKTAHLFGGVYSLIAQIRARIQKDIGTLVTASFGVSHNKLLAKLGSGLKKPNGLVVITKENLDSVYKNAKLTDICGIGEGFKKRLWAMGIYSLLQLRQVPLQSLIAEFGNVQGRILQDIGHGFDDTPVIPYTIAPTVKSVGRNYCLPKNEYSQQDILQNVFELCEEIGIKLRRLKKKARTVGLSLRGFRIEHGNKTIPGYIHSGWDIFSVCRQLYDAWQWDKSLDPSLCMVRMISVWASNLQDGSTLPSPLFIEERKKESVLKVVDMINERYGDHTIRNGFLLYAKKLTTVPNGYMADRYERTELAQEDYSV